jgi:hypothetical protein
MKQLQTLDKVIIEEDIRLYSNNEKPLQKVIEKIKYYDSQNYDTEEQKDLLYRKIAIKLFNVYCEKNGKI